ncbi:hypothetical protein [Actinomadura sp. GTD37]|uniref:hypothetical protein n=1 Tax=Actinomadura sp. GTD37 TaxID=1778030 RepID=UPI0035BEF7BC
MLLSAFMVIPVAGCHDAGPRETRPPSDVRPVSDTAPYLCDLMSELAFRQVVGATAPLKSDWAGPHVDQGLCVAMPPKGRAPLAVEWSYEDGEKILRTQRNNWSNESHYQLPSDLGRGLAGYQPSGGLDGRPYYVIALFRCGKKKPWISIDFVRVVRGRDAVQDMFDFIRIAEKRFGEIHKCTPRPL